MAAARNVCTHSTFRAAVFRVQVGIMIVSSWLGAPIEEKRYI